MIVEHEDYVKAVQESLGLSVWTQLNEGLICNTEIDVLSSDLSIRNKICHGIFRICAEKTPEASMVVGTPPVLRQLNFFWDSESPPDDVVQTIASWEKLGPGFSRTRFDDRQALAFIEANYSQRYAEAFSWCGHPAMRADYFRLCYAFKAGGSYVDADDAYEGEGFEALLRSGAHLSLHPMVWDLEHQRNLGVEEWELAAGFRPDWGYYFNNAPLIAKPGSFAVEKALELATQNIQAAANGEPGRGFVDIHAMTGPAVLTTGIVWQALMAAAGRLVAQSLRPLFEWTNVAKMQGLQYKLDDRNWRSFRQPLGVAGTVVG